MDTEFLGFKKENFNLLLVVLLLVIFGIVSFNAYSVWYVKAKDKIGAGVGMGADIGLDIPFLRR